MGRGRWFDQARGELVAKDEQGLLGNAATAGGPQRVQSQELKPFLTSEPAETSTGELLLVACCRWRVERCLMDQKTELGFDHFEGCSYLALMRHQTVTALTHLFLPEVQHALRGENPN